MEVPKKGLLQREKALQTVQREIEQTVADNGRQPPLNHCNSLSLSLPKPLASASSASKSRLSLHLSLSSLPKLSFQGSRRRKTRSTSQLRRRLAQLTPSLSLSSPPLSRLPSDPQADPCHRRGRVEDMDGRSNGKASGMGATKDREREGEEQMRVSFA